MKISTILDQIDLGSMALPEFQRGYVWNRDQVRGLMDSLYRKHPVGGLLVWETKTENANARGDAPLASGTVKLLLDGQQRITSLYGLIRGRPPKFFDGNDQAFTGLYFNLEDETFKFYSPLEMKGNLLWISVTDLIQQGIGVFLGRLYADPALQPRMNVYAQRLSAIDNIKETDLHIEQVSGEDKTVDVVVEIFNKVNSGGTKLSKGDLALAKICAAWPEARQEMQDRLAQWSKAGFYFNLDWLLRNITTVLTGQAMFSGLATVSATQFQQGLQQTEKVCNNLLNIVSGRLGLDHDRVLGGRYAFPAMSRYLALQHNHITNARELDQMLYWYIHSFLWGRYAGSTESTLNQDLRHIDGTPGALDRLIDQLRQTRGDLRVRPDDFGGNSMGARFYPMLYLLTRVLKARDWDNGGLELNAHLLGKLNLLQVHHIFPKAQLYKQGYQRGEVNAIANFCFLTQQTNLLISDQLPEVYFEEVERKYPGALASQWIPLDRELWKMERYHDFLAARRNLLAQAANTFLDSLLAGTVSETPVADGALDRPATVSIVVGGVNGEEEEQVIQQCNDWVVQHGLPHGEYMHELTDAATGQALAVLDLAWPKGLQEGYSQPVALLIGEDQAVESLVNSLGYRYFTNPQDFRTYVEREVLQVAEEAV